MIAFVYIFIIKTQIYVRIVKSDRGITKFRYQIGTVETKGCQDNILGLREYNVLNLRLDHHHTELEETTNDVEVITDNVVKTACTLNQIKSKIAIFKYASNCLRIVILQINFLSDYYF